MSRRKRYKKGHIEFLALEASTLMFKHIDERVMFHTSRQRYGKTKPRPCDLYHDHRISSFSQISEDGLLVAAYSLIIDPLELEKQKLTSAQVVKNVRKSMETCVDSWSGRVSVGKISVTKNDEGKLILWMIFNTTIKGWEQRKHNSLSYCLTTAQLEDEAGQMFEIYGAVHYVLMTCLFEYPGYFINGKVD